MLVDPLPAIRVIADDSFHACYGNGREPVGAWLGNFAMRMTVV